MKKTAAALAAFTLCAAMLTSCGETSTELRDETTVSTAAETKGVSIVETEKQTTREETTSAASEETSSYESETVPETEVTPDGGDKYSFASMEEFSKADFSSFDYDEVSPENSMTSKFFDTIKGGSGFYLDMETLDGTMAMKFAFAEDKLSLDAVDETGERFILIVSDSKMYMLDPAESTGFYMTADKSIFDEYNAEEILSEAEIDEEDFSGNEYVNNCAVVIDGRNYIFEGADSGGILYDEDGKISAVFNNDDREISAMLIHEFTNEIPSGSFDVPEGYELTDLEAALDALQQ